MEKELKIFLEKLMAKLNKRYDELDKRDDGDGFYAAKAFSYYDVLDIIEQQLEVFQYDKKVFKQPIVPLLGHKKKIKRNVLK